MAEFKKQVEGFSTKAIHVEHDTEAKEIVQPIVTTAIFRQTEPDAEAVSENIELCKHFLIFFF